MTIAAYELLTAFGAYRVAMGQGLTFDVDALESFLSHVKIEITAD